MAHGLKLYSFEWRTPRVDRLEGQSPTLRKRKRLEFVSSVAADEYANLLARHLSRIFSDANIDTIATPTLDRKPPKAMRL